MDKPILDSAGEHIQALAFEAGWLKQTMINVENDLEAAFKLKDWKRVERCVTALRSGRLEVGPAAAASVRETQERRVSAPRRTA